MYRCFCNKCGVELTGQKRGPYSNRLPLVGTLCDDKKENDYWIFPKFFFSKEGLLDEGVTINIKFKFVIEPFNENSHYCDDCLKKAFSILLKEYIDFLTSNLEQSK